MIENTTPTNYQELKEYLQSQSSEMDGVVGQIDVMMESVVDSIIGKILIDIESANPDAPNQLLVELVSFWEGQSGNVEVGSDADKKRKVAINKILSGYSQFLFSKGIIFASQQDQGITESVAGLAERMNAFYAYLFGISSKDQTVLLMRKVCKCFNLLCASDDIDKIKESLKEFPPSSIDLACIGGSIVRADATIRELSISPDVEPFFNGYELAINKATQHLKDEVRAGNHIHLRPFLEYCSGFIDKSLISDELFNSPLDQVSPDKMLKVAEEFTDHLKSFWKEKYQDSETFLFVINACHQFESGEVEWVFVLDALTGIGITNISEVMLEDDESQFDWAKLSQKIIEIKSEKLAGFRRFCDVYLEEIEQEVLVVDLAMDVDSGSEGSFTNSPSRRSVVVPEPTRNGVIRTEAGKIVADLKNPEKQLSALRNLWLASYLPNKSDNHLLFVRAIYDIWKALPKGKHSSENYLENVKQFFGNIRDQIPAGESNKRSRVQDIIERLDVDKFKYLFGVAYYQGLISKPPQDIGIDVVDGKKFTGDEDQKKKILSLAIEAGLEKAVVEMFNRVKDANGQPAFTVEMVLNEKGDLPLHIAAKSGKAEVVIKLKELGANVNVVNSMGRTPAMEAVRYNALGSFENNPLLVGADFSMTDVKRNSLMHYAASSGNIELLRKAIDSGLSINTANAAGETPLIMAVRRNDINTVNEILKVDGLEIDKTDAMRCTALFHALNQENFKMIDVLLKTGADINMEVLVVSSQTILNSIIIKGDASIIKGDDSLIGYLLEKKSEIGLDLDRANFLDGNTPLHTACELGDHKITQLLVKNGANPNIANRIGQTPLYFAINKASETGVPDAINTLLENGADINQINQLQQALNGKEVFCSTALEFACFLGDVGVVEFLMKQGANIDHCLFLDRAPDGIEFYSVRNPNPVGGNIEGGIIELIVETYEMMNFVNQDQENIEQIKEAIEGGAMVNYKKDGKTALMIACEKDKMEVVKLLIEKGANISDLFNEQGEIIIASCSEEIKRLLISNHMINAVRTGNLEVARTMLLNGLWVVNVLDQNGKTLLENALRLREPAQDLVKFLIANGADFSGCIVDTYCIESGIDKDCGQIILNTNRLLVALETGIWGGVGLDFSKDKDRKMIVGDQDKIVINAKNKDGLSALHLAVRNNNKDAVKFLLENGADINIKDNKGETLLHWAINMRHKDIMLMLIDNGIDYGAKNGDGKDALEVATDYMDEDYTDIIDIASKHINSIKKRSMPEGEVEEPPSKRRQGSPEPSPSPKSNHPENLQDEESNRQQ